MGNTKNRHSKPPPRDPLFPLILERVFEGKGVFLSSWDFIILSAQYKEERWHTVEGACWCAYEVGGKESCSGWGSSSWLGVCVSSVQKNKIYKDLFLQRIVLTKVLAIEFCTAAGLLPSLAWEIITSAGMIVWLKESTD